MPRPPPTSPLTYPLLPPPTPFRSAINDAGAERRETVGVGPYSSIGPGGTIGAGTWIGPHVVRRGPMTIGRDNKIFQFASLGEISQDMSARPDDATRVEIGDGNTIREYVTIQRGTLKEAAALTRVGDHNWIMNAVHSGHDSIIGNHNILANNTALAGHVLLGNKVGRSEKRRVGKESVSTC